MITLVISASGNSIDLFIDEKSKQHTEERRYSQSYAPGSPSVSAYSGINPSSQPATSSIMSPGHSLPTGMPNLEKPETIPEIQMPSMATLDPFLRGSSDQDYPSKTFYLFIELI
jgi:hypothetical protein